MCVKNKRDSFGFAWIQSTACSFLFLFVFSFSFASSYHLMISPQLFSRFVMCYWTLSPWHKHHMHTHTHAGIVSFCTDDLICWLIWHLLCGSSAYVCWFHNFHYFLIEKENSDEPTNKNLWISELFRARFVFIFLCLFLFLINVFSCFCAQMFATTKQSILVFEAAVDKLSEEYFILAHILTSRLAAMRKRKRWRERKSRRMCFLHTIQTRSILKR